MTMIATSTILAVSELRERWLPHKERFNSAGSGHPTAVRFHRACSWLEEAERFHNEDQTDHGVNEDWGIMCYPPVDNGASDIRRRRPS